MKLFIVIAGMHRSGTSFLARALNLSGVYLGTLKSLTLTELNADKSNPRGHWENREFIRIGKETRKLIKLNYRNAPKKIVINEKIANDLKNTINDLMKHPSMAAGFKDPHALLYLKDWMKYFPKNTIIISIFRHPLKVAESLRIRDNRNYQESLRIWEVCNKGLLDALEEYNGFVLDFDWDEEKLLSELNAIIKKIGLLEVDFREWYTQELKRSDRSFEKKIELSNNILEIYSKLKERSERNNEIEVEKIQQSRDELYKILAAQSEEDLEQMKHFRILLDNSNNKIQTLDQIKNTKLGLLTILLSAYESRPRLKQKFPEVSSGNLIGLLEWVIQGNYKEIRSGEDIKIIKKNIEFYKQELDKIKNENNNEKSYELEYLREELKKTKNNLAKLNKNPIWRILSKLNRN